MAKETQKANVFGLSKREEFLSDPKGISDESLRGAMDIEKPISSSTSKNDTNVGRKRGLVCFLAVVVCVTALAVIAGCFVVLFIEIADLKASIKRSSFNQQISNDSTITTMQMRNMIVEKLNSSIESNYQQIYQELSELSNLIDENSRQLNLSIQMMRF